MSKHVARCPMCFARVTRRTWPNHWAMHYRDGLVDPWRWLDYREFEASLQLKGASDD